MRVTIVKLLPLAALAVCLAGLSPTPAADDDGFKPLFNGKDLTGFKTVGVKDDTFKVEDGEIHCTGSPNGYFVTDKSYKNYHLKFEVQYPKQSGNSGVLVHIQPPDKVWPKCVEAQGMHKDMGNLFSIGGAPKGDFKKDAEGQKNAIKPVGEWNVYEVISQDGKLTTKINGTKVAEGSSELKEGPIGWQSEGAPIWFRKIMIKEVK